MPSIDTNHHMASFKQLVRFADGGSCYYGDLIETTDSGYRVRRLKGSLFKNLEGTDDVIETKELLCPLEQTPVIICIGLNYRTHAKEANLSIPKHPAVFMKPADALSGPNDDVYCHPDTRTLLDFEGELCIVLGKDAKNVTEDDALDYILGYTAGNDVSARNFQLPEVSGGQFCYAKSFDGFAPIGHTITSPAELSHPLVARLMTKVNGIIKQDSSTSDMVFNPSQIVSFLSRGTTLRKGTVIMTGTPAGVGYFRKEFLQDGDIVEVEIDGVGKVRNKIVF